MFREKKKIPVVPETVIVFLAAVATWRIHLKGISCTGIEIKQVLNTLYLHVK
jgi:hypothetical protein